MAGEVSLAVAAKATAENFPVALRVLPKNLRRHLTAYYGFARLTDDIGDEPLPGITGSLSPDEDRATRIRLLDELEADVRKIYDGHAEPALPAIRALKETVKATGIPFGDLADLIQANRQDQLVTRYDAYADLVRYCELSANPVGRAVLYIVGAATDERIALSDKICTALQLVEHWQDVAEDLANGRVYLPQEDLRAHGVTEADLARPTRERGRGQPAEVRDRARDAAARRGIAAGRHPQGLRQAGHLRVHRRGPGGPDGDPAERVRRPARDAAAREGNDAGRAGQLLRHREVSVDAEGRRGWRRGGGGRRGWPGRGGLRRVRTDHLGAGAELRVRHQAAAAAQAAGARRRLCLRPSN